MSEVSVLKKYEHQIKSASSCFTYGRDVFSAWTSSKITFLSMIMQPENFYAYLVECKFINNEHVTCDSCNPKMAIWKSEAKK